MQNNYILTGSIASGKSSVLKIIADEGYMTISADDVVKELYKDEEFLKSFKELIGKEYFAEGVKLDKDKDVASWELDPFECPGDKNEEKQLSR